MILITVCAWCGCEVGRREAEVDASLLQGEETPISHGICETCTHKMHISAGKPGKVTLLKKVTGGGLTRF